MEYLRNLFFEELDEEGDIQIAGETFIRHEILRNMAPSACELAFNEWVENRKNELLKKAEDILEKYENRQRFKRLYSAFKAGKMMPFVGAGMSISSGYPAWTEYLYRLSFESNISKDNIDGLLTNGCYEEAAQLIHDNLGAPTFNTELEETYCQERDLAGAVNYLPLMFPEVSIITTNFDLVIEQVYKNAKACDSGFDIIQSGRNLAEVLRQMSGGSRLLIKLHGDCRQLGNRVLLKTEYDSAYSEAGVVSQFFNRVIFGQPLLFLGCSLSVDRTINKMKKIVKDFGSESLPKHYAILELKNGDDRKALKKHLSEANIFPIWYKEGEHDESLEALFLKLMED